MLNPETSATHWPKCCRMSTRRSAASFSGTSERLDWLPVNWARADNEFMISPWS